MSDQDGVAVRRTRIDVGGAKIEGWEAEFDGTISTGISREEALRQLVVDVGREAL